MDNSSYNISRNDTFSTLSPDASGLPLCVLAAAVPLYLPRARLLSVRLTSHVLHIRRPPRSEVKNQNHIPTISVEHPRAPGSNVGRMPPFDLRGAGPGLPDG